MNGSSPVTSGTRNRFWEAAATVWSAVVIGLAVSPLRNVDLITAPISDKVLHAIAFLFGTMIWAGALENQSGQIKSVGLAGSVCFALGGVIELLQTQTATRSAESGDLAADLIGIVIGGFIWAMIRGMSSSSHSSSLTS